MTDPKPNPLAALLLKRQADKLRNALARAEAVLNETAEEHEANAAWLRDVQALLNPKGETR